MKEVVFLEITSFRFAIGGEHYYGKLHVYNSGTRVRTDKGEVTRISTSDPEHPLHHTELRRKLTDPAEVAYLQEKDNDDWIKLGMDTTRFNTTSDIREVAKTFFAENFDADDLLVEARYAEFEYAEPLAGPEDVCADFASCEDYADVRKMLNGHGYLAPRQTIDERAG